MTHLFVSLCPEACLGLVLNRLSGSLAVVIPFLLAHLPVRPVVLGVFPAELFLLFFLNCFFFRVNY